MRVRQVLSMTGEIDSTFDSIRTHTSNPLSLLQSVPSSLSSSHHSHLLFTPSRCFFKDFLFFGSHATNTVSQLLQDARDYTEKPCNVCLPCYTNTIPKNIYVAVDHCISGISRHMHHVKPSSVASHTHTDFFFLGDEKYHLWLIMFFSVISLFL